MLKLPPKGLSDKEVAGICLKENRILITNDADFQEYSVNEIYAVIWLQIPQNRPDSLIKSFVKLLSECKQFKGKIIILQELVGKDFPLFISLS